MRSLHQRLINSEFKERYLTLKEQLPRIKHIIHGGIENYYAGLEPAHLLSSGIKDRLCDAAINRSISNLELGLEQVMGLEIVREELYIHCHLRPTQGEKMREAVWQYNILVDHKLAAAIGMNFHTEESQIVATIANIQGYDSEKITNLKEICGEIPWPVKSLSLILAHLPEDIQIIRGVSCNSHPLTDKGLDKHQASNLYDRTFRRLGMKAIRNQQSKVSYYELYR